MPDAREPRGASELIDLYLQVARRLGQAMHEHATRFELTPMQAMTLQQVGEEPLPASQLASNLRCDPSNATGLVDQLERRGLVQRTTPPSDRRKRVVEVTDHGRDVCAALRCAVDENWGPFDRLTAAERAELGRILEILATDDPAGGCGAC